MLISTIIAVVIIVMHMLLLVKNCIISCYKFTTGEVSVKGALNFKLQAVSCFVDVTQEVINKMEGSTILKSTKDTTKFGVTLFKRKL